MTRTSLRLRLNRSWCGKEHAQTSGLLWPFRRTRSLVPVLSSLLLASVGSVCSSLSLAAAQMPTTPVIREDPALYSNSEKEPSAPTKIQNPAQTPQAHRHRLSGSAKVAGPQSQSVPNNPISFIELTDGQAHGPLSFINSRGQYFMTCQAAGPDPEDYYDCTLAPGHSLDEVIRMTFRFQRNEREEHKKLVDEILSKWKHSLEVIRKSLHNLDQSDKGKT